MPRPAKTKTNRLSPELQQSVDNAYKHAQAHHNAGNLAGAEPIYRKILELDADHNAAAYALGTLLLEQQKPEDALPFIKRALPAFANMTEAHHIMMGLCLYYTGELPQAEKHLKKALQLNDRHALAYDTLGAMESDKLNFKAAEQYFIKALEAEPSFAQTCYHYAALLEKQSRLDEAQEMVKRGLAIAPDDLNLVLVQAKILKRLKEYDSALALLEKVNPGGHARAPDYYYECGQIFDRLDRPAEAFRAFAKANSLQGSGAVLMRRNVYLDRIKAYKKTVTPAWLKTWTTAPAQDRRQTPVFLIGFPRSGTTLLDQILTAQGSFTVAEEVDALNILREKIETRHKHYPDCLANLDPQEIASLRSSFVKDLKKMGRLEEGKIVVHKMPLDTIHASLVHRLFPEAKILFALRHPCDVVLSCFMQHFKLNTAMVHFLDMKNAAGFYEHTMSLWQQYQAVLPLSIHYVRYESVVADFTGEVRRMLEFLDVPWNDAVLEFDKTARAREKINTPSYSQVTEKIYTRASGRWKRYEEQMAPVLNTLRPWAEHFGYEM